MTALVADPDSRSDWRHPAGRIARSTAAVDLPTGDAPTASDTSEPNNRRDNAVDSLVMFAHSLQSTQPLAVSFGRDELAPCELEPRPFAVLGRASQCDVTLPDQTVSLRHVLLQAFRDRVFAIDLFSANGCKLDGQRFKAGWLTPDDALKVGPFQLATNATAGQPQTALADEPPSPLDFKPRKEDSDFYGPLPKVELQLLSAKRDPIMWPINRVMTLLGRSEHCRITCSDESISSVHCALVLTPAGLWIVDAVTRTGTHLNGERVRCGLLVDGHELTVGKYTLRAVYDRSEMPAPPSPEPVMQASPTMSRAAQTVAFKTKNHRVFKAETAAPVLIVKPQGDIQEFRYQDVQLEANALIAALTTPDFPHLIVDFSDVQVVKSVMLEAVAGICRAAKGRAAFCCASPQMYASLADTKLQTLWYHYNSREDAIAAVTYPG